MFYLRSLGLIVLAVFVVQNVCGQTDEQVQRLTRRLEALEKRNLEQTFSHAVERRHFQEELARQNAAIQEQFDAIHRLEVQSATDRQTYEQVLARLSSDMNRQAAILNELTMSMKRLQHQATFGGNTSYVGGQREERQTDTNEPIAFMAHISKFGESLPISLKEIFIFNTVLTNIGNAYDVTTGVFRAPTAGVYMFSVSLTSYKGAHPLIEASLMRNGAAVGFAFANGESGHFDQGALTVALTLEAGDLVWVENLFPNQTTYSGGPYTSFSGCRVTKY